MPVSGGGGCLAESCCRPRVWVGCDWVEHNFCAELGLARCWVLRGHPGGGFLWPRGSRVVLTPSLVGVVAFVGLVWLWVECCIVDASILLWSSC